MLENSVDSRVAFQSVAGSSLIPGDPGLDASLGVAAEIAARRRTWNESHTSGLTTRD